VHLVLAEDFQGRQVMTQVRRPERPLRRADSFGGGLKARGRYPPIREQSRAAFLAAIACRFI
jgi:hypothetical protein